MRSVVVVLPASMCAMMPMLRTLVRSVRTSCATEKFSSRSLRSWGAPVSGGGSVGAGHGRPRPSLSPAVVREGLVRLGHLVGVLATLHRGPEAVARVEDLVHEALGHRLLATLTGVADEPAQRERRRAAGLDLDRDLVGRTTDAAGLVLQGRLDVVQCALERLHRVGAGLLAAALEGVVDDGLGDGLLALDEDLVDQLRHQRGLVDGVDDERALRSGTLARHYFFSFLAP